MTMKINNNNLTTQGSRTYAGQELPAAQKNMSCEKLTDWIRNNSAAVDGWSTEAKRQAAARIGYDGDGRAARNILLASCRSKEERDAVFPNKQNWDQDRDWVVQMWTDLDTKSTENWVAPDEFNPEALAGQAEEATMVLRRARAALSDPTVSEAAKAALTAAYGDADAMSAAIEALETYVDALKNHPEVIDTDTELDDIKASISSFQHARRDAEVAVSAALGTTQAPGSLAMDYAPLALSGTTTDGATTDATNAAGQDLADLPASELLDKFMRGELKAADLGQAALLKIEIENNERNQITSMLSNLIKSQHEQVMAVVRNLA